MTTKIAVLSDIHGNAVALRSVVRDIRREGIQSCIFLGDLIAKGPQPLEVLELLYDIRPIQWILGNTDLWMNRIYSGNSPRIQSIREYQTFIRRWLSPEDIQLVLQRPENSVIRIGKTSIRCLHGSPRHIAEAITPDMPAAKLHAMLAGVQEPVILCGHSHISCSLKTSLHTILNPGSVGCPYDGNPDASYGIITVEKEARTGTLLHFSIKRVSYSREEILQIARQRNYPFYSTYARLLYCGQKISF
ncbi:MAG: YfcE family phosphodiesterase [Ethanoligenens sp.]